MIDSLKNMLGMGPKADFAKLVKEGAVIVDVRTKEEYRGGHIKGSLNIPLNAIQHEMKKLPKNKVIITCCASGMRSASAKNVLQSAGYKEVYNGGGWASLNQKIH
ncbi:MAG: rhodanese-like domain-containing protein [Bacteroidota bacterium]